LKKVERPYRELQVHRNVEEDTFSKRFSKTKAIELGSLLDGEAVEEPKKPENIRVF
jgi:hypothetical protein